MASHNSFFGGGFLCPEVRVVFEMLDELQMYNAKQGELLDALSGCKSSDPPLAA